MENAKKESLSAAGALLPKGFNFFSDNFIEVLVM